MSRLLEVEDLHTYYESDRGTVHAVRGVTLSLDHGSSLAVVGESGAGKSVFVRTILGVHPRGVRVRTEGTVRVDGHDMLGATPEERRELLGTTIGMIHQDPLTSLNPTYRIDDQVVESLLTHGGLPRAKRRPRAIEALRAAGMNNAEELAGRYPSQLSGGQRQRAGIAAASITSPALLIGDEPTTALDVTVQRRVLDELDEVRSATQSAFLLITHDLAVAAERCDHIAVMYAGRFVEQGPTAQVLAHTTHPYTVALLGCTPRIDGPRPRRLPTVPDPSTWQEQS